MGKKEEVLTVEIEELKKKLESVRINLQVHKEELDMTRDALMPWVDWRHNQDFRDIRVPTIAGMVIEKIEAQKVTIELERNRSQDILDRFIPRKGESKKPQCCHTEARGSEYCSGCSFNL
jgi:hypothetical protein